MLYFIAWDTVGREKKKKAQYFNFGPNLSTCKPGAGQEAGTGLRYPWWGGHSSLGGEDEARQTSPQPGPFQYPHRCREPPWACGLNSAIINA